MKAYFTIYEIDNDSKKKLGCLFNIEHIDIQKLFEILPLETEDAQSPEIRYLALGRILRYNNRRYKVVNFILTPYTPNENTEAILQIILSVEELYS